MKTCERCGLVSPESSAQCECGGRLIAGDSSTIARNGTVAGFWIRLVSDVIDAMFLGIAGWILVMVFRAPLLKLGDRAVLLGVPISLLYTAVLHSRIGGGQTLAKRVLNLRVVRTDGSLLSFDRAVVRWALIGFLFYGGAAGQALLGVAPFLKPELVFAAFGGVQLALFLGCGLLTAFHPLKRGLHDLLTGSMVVRRALPPAEFVAARQSPIRDRRLILGAVSLAIVASLGAVFIRFDPPREAADALGVVQGMRALGIQSPSLGETTFIGTGGQRRFIIAGGSVPGTSAAALDLDGSDLHEKLAVLVRDRLQMQGVDEIRTVLRTGINLGVYSSYQTSTKAHRPTSSTATR
jgi:uncharacterized RDD family membrane protein YckC